MSRRLIHRIVLIYEQFCEDPLTIVSAFDLDKSEFSKTVTVQVKAYEAQAIRNMNDEQIAQLSEWQKDLISEMLTGYEDLLAYFGYELLR